MCASDTGDLNKLVRIMYIMLNNVPKCTLFFIRLC